MLFYVMGLIYQISSRFSCEIDQTDFKLKITNPKHHQIFIIKFSDRIIPQEQLLESILYLFLIIQSLLYKFHTMSPNAMYTVNKTL